MANLIVALFAVMIILAAMTGLWQGALGPQSKLSSSFRDLKDRTVFITGASRGIGKAIALRCARDGANVVVAAKTVDNSGKLPGTASPWC